MEQTPAARDDQQDRRAYLQGERDENQTRRDERLQHREEYADSGTVMQLQERLSGLERWQVAQNGTLKSLADKADQAAQKTDIVRVENSQKDDSKRLEDKIDHLVYWIMGSLLTGFLALVGIVVTLLRQGKT